MFTMTKEQYNILKLQNLTKILYKKWDKEENIYVDVNETEKSFLQFKVIDTRKKIKEEEKQFLQNLLSEINLWSKKSYEIIKDRSEHSRYTRLCSYIEENIKNILNQENYNHAVCIYFKQTPNFKETYAIGMINHKKNKIDFALSYPLSQAPRNKRENNIIGLCGYNIGIFMIEYAFETLGINKVKMDVISPKLKESLERKSIKDKKSNSKCTIS